LKLHYICFSLIKKFPSKMEKKCNIMTKQLVACVAGPQFYGGPDLQRGGPATQSKQLAAQPRLWSKGFKT
jgi:hypothetical protein